MVREDEKRKVSDHECHVHECASRVALSICWIAEAFQRTADSGSSEARRTRWYRLPDLTETFDGAEVVSLPASSFALAPLLAAAFAFSLAFRERSFEPISSVEQRYWSHDR